MCICSALVRIPPIYLEKPVFVQVLKANRVYRKSLQGIYLFAGWERARTSWYPQSWDSRRLRHFTDECLGPPSSLLDEVLYNQPVVERNL